MTNRNKQFLIGFLMFYTSAIFITIKVIAIEDGSFDYLSLWEWSQSLLAFLVLMYGVDKIISLVK